MPTYVPILDAEIAAEQPVTVSLMTRLRDNALAYLGAPLGTFMAFQQSAAPLGWTKQTTHHDKVLRLVTGSAGAGGLLAFSTVFGKTATDAFSIAQANLPNIQLNLTGTPTSTATATIGGNDAQGIRAGVATATTVSADIATGPTALVYDTTQFNAINIGVNIGLSGVKAALGGSNTALTAPIDTRVQYVDFIIARKD